MLTGRMKAPRWSCRALLMSLSAIGWVGVLQAITIREMWRCTRDDARARLRGPKEGGPARGQAVMPRAHGLGARTGSRRPPYAGSSVRVLTLLSMLLVMQNTSRYSISGSTP